MPARVIEGMWIAPQCSDTWCGDPGCQRTVADFNEDGYDAAGYDVDGYTADGFNMAGRDRDGYNVYGYNSQGYDREGYNEDGIDDSGHDRYGNCHHDDDDDYYHDDYEDRYDNGLLSYSYTPELIFRGDNGPYFGMEIEVTSDSVKAAVAVVKASTQKFGENKLIYCKSDSSVEGLEMVTHPMSYLWAMENFPWEMLPVLRQTAGCSIVPQENGIHIHVGRDAFASPAHTYRWMKLWYRNPNDIQRIARRRANSWAAFSPDQRAGQKEHVKMGKPGYKRRQDGTLSTRYAAINTTNDATLEIRVFASSLRPQRVKAALQLVAASVEYTRTLSADAVTHRHGWEWASFMAWVKKAGIYPDLVAEDRIRRSS